MAREALGSGGFRLLGTRRAEIQGEPGRDQVEEVIR
jgi:hypothetical protein